MLKKGLALALTSNVNLKWLRHFSLSKRNLIAIVVQILFNIKKCLITNYLYALV